MAEEPITLSEIIGGIRKGITPDKPGMYFNYFKEAITSAEEEIREYRIMMYRKYGETRREYLDKIPSGAERELAHELGARIIRLYNIASKYLVSQGHLIPEGEKEKYRRQSIPVGLTPEEYKLWERGELEWKVKS
jgi:hypothetical protein